MIKRAYRTRPLTKEDKPPYITRYLFMDDELIDQIEFDDEPSKDDNPYGKKNIWKCPVCELNRHVGNHKHCSKVTQLKYKND